VLRYLPGVILGYAVLTVSLLSAQSEQVAAPKTAVEVESDTPDGDLPALPAMPKGTTTILGGAIRNLDPVRDQFSLVIYRQRPMKILFDERTQVFRDGVKIPLRDLRPEDHASVQTILDGDNVFAVSIHILSQSPDGECQGHILNYNPQTGELEVSAALSPDPVKLLVPADALVVREGQSAFTSQSSGRNDLVAGALISATFKPAPGKRDVASRITVLAVPGSSFLFAGTISHLDLPMGVLDVVDPRDGKSYEIHFASAHIPAGGNVHVGESVTVKAYYDGSRYQAAEITAQ
jgi:hypothetical protein